MIFKITLSVSGDNFYPEEIIGKIMGNFTVESYFSPRDENMQYEYGTILFWHPKKFVLQDDIQNYENSFVEFIYINHDLFINNGITDFSFFIEVYHNDSNCNFEVFNSENLKRIRHLNYSLPISTYRLNKKDFKKWANEIKLDWESAVE